MVTPEMRKKRFDSADLSADGRLNPDEFTLYYYAFVHSHVHGATVMHKMLDLDADGVVSINEVRCWV